ARASVSLDLSVHERARIAAEQAAEVEKLTTASNTRFFLLALLAAIVILGVLSWFYVRVRKDRKVISQQNAIVSQSLSEKEVLLREIHHRVKNNLQIISSLLQKQARISGDAGARQFAKEGQERIQSMALVHENLYQSEQLNGVNIKDYLTNLANNIERSHKSTGTEINLQLMAEDKQLDLDTAIPVGLILNELLTNAYKYAFPGREKGTIKVEFSETATQYQLIISDDGVGLPTDHTERRSNSLGHNLVNGLVRQLDGTIQWSATSTPGTTVTINF
ncbi:MAG: sensor histidine kinase, partial [Bacteroidota bacterium]